MNSSITSVKRKQQYRFLALYLSSMVLLSTLFIVLWNIYKAPTSALAQKDVSGTNSQSLVLQEFGEVFMHFKKLQELDNRQRLEHTGNEDKNAARAIGKLMIEQEDSLRASLDAIINREGQHSAIVSAGTDSLVAMFQQALINRKYFLSSVAYVQDKETDMPAQTQQVFKLRDELMIKDTRINVLENDLAKFKREVSKVDSENSPNLKLELATLETEMQKVKTANLELSGKNNSLTKELQVYASAVKTDRNEKTVSADIGPSAKMEALQGKISGLEAKLIFAQVDCNLSRADGRKIISNSRQRMELLQQSLETLSDLAKSDNVEIRTKAKEKTTYLQQLAVTLRD